MQNPFEILPNLGTVNQSFKEYQHPLEPQTKEIIEEESDKTNLSIFYWLAVIASLVLVFKLLDLQIAQGAKHQYLAEGNRLRSRNIPAPRGAIYDRQGQILAKNIASFNLEIYPADLPKDKTEREKIYQEVEKYSQIPIEELRNQVEAKGLFSLDPIVLWENIPRDEALLLEIRYKDYSGVVVNKQPVREYKNIAGLAHILGYVGKITQEELDQQPGYKISDQYGKTGVELIYEKNLRGQDGKEQVEVDALGRLQRILATQRVNPGNNLFITLDLGLQEKMAQALSAMAGKLGDKKAVAIAQNPQNGEILGLVNIPSYNNNIFQQANLDQEYQKLLANPAKPLLNRAVSGTYPSGSTIKPFIASAGLQERVISANTTINDPGEIRLGEWVFPDWKNHGLVDVKKAIAESCNVFFYAVGGGWEKIKGLGVNKINDYLQKFGFGAQTGLDLPAEAEGLIPTPEWKKKSKKESWYIGDTYHLAIGQGDFLVTPLQMVNAVSAIANGGQLLQPRLFYQETDNTGKLIKEAQTQTIREKFIGSYELMIVRQGMRQTVEAGSARSLADLPVAVAGKTGTAQFGSGEETHAWFTAFAPYDNPQIALVVLIEAGGEGSSQAVPVAKEILQYYFTKGE